MPAAATGPGVGGMNTCEANRPAARASIKGTGDVPDRRASDLPIGLTSTKPLSQNTGIDTIHPMSIIARRGCRLPTTRSTARARATAPPVRSSTLPISVPKIITSAMLLNTPLNPLPITSGRSVYGTPSTTASNIAVPSIARNGWTFHRAIATTINMMAAANISNVPIVVITAKLRHKIQRIKI